MAQPLAQAIYKLHLKNTDHLNKLVINTTPAVVGVSEMVLYANGPAELHSTTAALISIIGIQDSMGKVELLDSDKDSLMAQRIVTELMESKTPKVGEDPPSTEIYLGRNLGLTVAETNVFLNVETKVMAAVTIEKLGIMTYSGAMTLEEFFSKAVRNCKHPVGLLHKLASPQVNFDFKIHGEVKFNVIYNDLVYTFHLVEYKE